MKHYIRFENNRQIESVMGTRKPGNDWYIAPADYDGSRLCVLENDSPRLLTEDEIQVETLTLRRTAMQQMVAATADAIRSEITAGTTASEREGWQVKADICRLYRIEQVLQQAGILATDKRLLSTAEIEAVQAEAEERNRGETEADILALWEARSGAFAKAVCRIDGVGSKAWAALEQAEPGELEAVAAQLLKTAEVKKAAVLAAVGQ